MIMTVTNFFLFKQNCIGAFCLALCLSGIVGLSGVNNNETRNGSLPVLLSDQASEDDDSKRGCIDWEGKPVKDGEKYVPNKNDMCMRCTCAGHFPLTCHSVACSPPLDCTNVKLVSGACCEYECLDNIGRNVTDLGNNPSSDNSESITNLSLRLIASTVTSLLFLALLLFMVHRLRQRRMLMAMRRFQARSDVCISDDMDCDRNIPDNFMSLECPPYTDPPPPYSPPKPPHILPGEQPPPYDEISIAEIASRESRSGSSQEERNSHESRQTSEITMNSPVRAELHNESNQSNTFHQLYSSPQNPPFGVEMEMPRNPVPSQDASVNQNNDILPAYASTDIVFRNATFSTMVTPPHRQPDSSNSPPHLSNNVEILGANGDSSSSATTTGMPTLTAFQRFSSLFKRDKSKYKNRSTSQQRRPVSEFIPPHYATLSRTHHTLTTTSPDDDQSSRDDSDLSNVIYRHNGNRNGESRVRSCYPNLSLTDRMRLSYDSARAAYELAALSPSTSSSSSISVDQLPPQDGSITTSCVPSSSTYSTSVVPPTQSSARHSQECDHEILQHPIENINLQRCEGSPMNSSSIHSLPTNSNVGNTPTQSLAQSKHYNGNAKCGTDRNSSIYNDKNSSVRNKETCFNSNDRHFESEQPHLNENNDIASYCGNRIRNLNSLTNSHSAVIPPETSNHESSSSAKEDVPGRSCVFPPSPLPTLGQMRRSHSSTSQVSAFSVCSETGEKKLKDIKHESDSSGRPLASDCQYPPHPHGLSQPYNKPNKNLPHSSTLIFRGHPNPLSVKRGAASIPVTSTPSSTLQTATLVVPISDHPSLSSNNGISSQNRHFRQKDLNIDLQGFEDDNVSSTAVQSSPISPPFVTVQSGKLISNPPPPAPAVEWPVGRDTSDPLGKICHENIDESKKFRKKRDKEKRCTSLPFKQKDTSSSPNHSYKDVVKTKHDLANVKSKHPRFSNTKGVPSRKVEKKRVAHFQPSPNFIDNSILPDFEDFSTPYGNADVYRSQAYDQSIPTSTFPVLQSPFHKYLDKNPDANQLDTKRSHTFSPPKAAVHDFGAASYNNNLSSRHPQQPNLVKYPSPQSRKRPGHKRQTSSGNRNPNAPGPSCSQKHNRSKSLTTTEKIHDADLVTNDTAFEQMVSGGRWVKSGFGHDLAFDDQLGGLDMGVSDRTVDPNYPNTHISKTNRGEGNTVSKNFEVTYPLHGPESKVATAAVVPLPTRRRSGLSQDLSFVNRSEVNPNPAKRMNKRSSLPGFLTFTNQQPQKNYCDSSDYVCNENLQQETEMPQKQSKNVKERRDRSNSNDKNGRYTATSYV